MAPSHEPSLMPSRRPSHEPSMVPSRIPSGSPTYSPSSSPSSSPVECFSNIDCDNKGKWLRCDSGRCILKPGTLDACATCRDVLEHHLTDCVYNPSCPSGFEFDRYENGPCWFGREREFCKKYSNEYACPPCPNNPLLGTCGYGNRGNGCCENGGGCSVYGWRGWHAGFIQQYGPLMNNA